jgi:glycine oxidase
MNHPDLCIAGAGIIGLSLALALHDRGLRVVVLDRNHPLAEASTAAAGMLAAADPDNPPQLRPLADLSISLYPGFLERLFELSGVHVPFQTHTTLQALPAHVTAAGNILSTQELAHLLPALIPGEHRFLLLDEHSLDPRQLATALLAAVRATPIELRPDTAVLAAESFADSVTIHTSRGVLHAAQFVDCTGSWAATTSPSHVKPMKGQMLSVSLPSSFPLHFVVRTPEIYIVPRTIDPFVTPAIIGATVEDIGFDKTVHSADIAGLRSLASALLPVLADAPERESWAGLRPTVRDHLPLLGPLSGQPRHLLATGHFRNGILLAPATAQVMAELIAGEIPSVDLSAFSPTRLLRDLQ